MKKSVEIVIPAYNEEKQLRESVLKLATFLNTELRKFIWKISRAVRALMTTSEMIFVSVFARIFLLDSMLNVL